MPGKLRELILLRHAKSDWQDTQLADIDRPLSDKGKKNATKMGKWIRKQGLMPDLILVSPAVRTQQTLKRICNECPANTITVDELYLADLNTLKIILANAPIAQRIMLIGHNPGLERLFNYLNQPPLEPTTHLFPTAALAHFIMPNNWTALEAGDGRLAQFVRPKEAS
jgi:phosphohistidine phosphatase